MVVEAGESGSGGRLLAAAAGGDDAEDGETAATLSVSSLRFPIRSNSDGRARRRSVLRPSIWRGEKGTLWLGFILSDWDSCVWKLGGRIDYGI